VIRAAACVSVAIRSVRAIDTRGLHVSNLGALADCMRAVAHEPIVDGDARSAAIAAASVVAKVTRDRYMHRVAGTYSRWNFAGNVGYSTPEHRDAIREHGISPLHRRSFASIAYTQLELDGDPDSERIADVIDIREAIAAEADPDDIEAIAGDA
jgi:ribonuclease HII